jgi:hypothetical protein
MKMVSHRLLVIIFSLGACFMTTGCFSCSLSTSEATPARTKSVQNQGHTIVVSNELQYRHQ